jgi:hypothetical protein
MINRAVIDFKSQSLKKEQAWETSVARKTRKRTSNSSDETQTRGAEEARQSPGQEARSRNRVKPIGGRGERV